MSKMSDIIDRFYAWSWRVPYTPSTLETDFDDFLKENSIVLTQDEYDIIYNALYDNYDELGTFRIDWD